MLLFSLTYLINVSGLFIRPCHYVRPPVSLSYLFCRGCKTILLLTQDDMWCGCLKGFISNIFFSTSTYKLLSDIFFILHLLQDYHVITDLFSQYSSFLCVFFLSIFWSRVFLNVKFRILKLSISMGSIFWSLKINEKGKHCYLTDIKTNLAGE